MLLDTAKYWHASWILNNIIVPSLLYSNTPPSQSFRCAMDVKYLAEMEEKRATFRHVGSATLKFLLEFLLEPYILPPR